MCIEKKFDKKFDKNSEKKTEISSHVELMMVMVFVQSGLSDEILIFSRLYMGEQCGNVLKKWTEGNEVM